MNNCAAAFTMVNCAPTKQESYDVSKESFVWYGKRSAELVSSVASWLEEMKQELGTYEYLEDVKKIVKDGTLEMLDFEYLKDSKATIVGDPEQVIETARAYEAAGVDLLLCLVNPYNISHEKVMQTIELMGKHVIPEFK